ncbi:MAG: nucleotidyltransferase [Gemmatimonadales bacterium]|nr:nucleotidyltransferase [Gemmatimonadales bacterium]
MSLLDLMGGLTGADIRFIIAGGVAGTVHGSRRVTDDLDILYDTEPENQRALAELLAAWHAYPRDVPAGLPFMMDAQTLRTTEILTLTTDKGMLDIFVRMQGVGTYAEALPEATVIALGSSEVRALNLDQLIAAKLAANRLKDREHLIELKALRELSQGS